MGKTTETTINRFGGGMTSDTRENANDKVALSLHFDMLDNKESLKPKRAYTTVTDSNAKILRNLYASGLTSDADTRLYGLGQTAGGKTEIFKANALPVASWTSVASASSTGLPDPRVFFHYKDNLYFWQNGTVLSSIDILSTPAITEAVTTLTANYTDVAQPVHHPADDIAYFFHDNKVSKLDGGSPTADILTLPDDLKIVGAAPYGNYLAILTSPIKVGTIPSVLYIWDRDSSLSTVTAKIDLGFAEAVHIGNDNNGIFITQVINSKNTIAGNENEALIVKYYNGIIIEKRIPVSTTNEYFKSIELADIDSSLPAGNSVSTDNVFHFPARVITRKDSVTYNVIFSAKITNGEIVLSANQNILSLGAGEYIKGIFELTGFWYIVHSDTTLLQTDQSTTFQQGIMETLLYSGGDASKTRKLLGATVTTAPLPANATVVLKYRVDNETSFTQIFTHTSTGSLRHSAINIESSAVNLPQYKEIQFRIESTSGAEITGLKFKSEVVEDDNY